MHIIWARKTGKWTHERSPLVRQRQETPPARRLRPRRLLGCRIQQPVALRLDRPIVLAGGSPQTVDICMSHMRGLESIRILHERAPAIPLVAMSGYALDNLEPPTPDFLRMALELGAARCLRKPFTPGAVIAPAEIIGDTARWAKRPSMAPSRSAALVGVCLP